VFAYGQTGSGKTFTIYGSAEQPGLTPRGVSELFKQIDADAGKSNYSVRLQMLELYQVIVQRCWRDQHQHMSYWQLCCFGRALNSSNFIINTLWGHCST
jgi:hypothetical protein